MDLYTWRGPEEPLVMACHATDFTIQNFSGSDTSGFKASGTISLVDYVEHGIRFSDPWEASRATGADAWDVKRPKDSGAFWIDRDTGEAYFTANIAVNRAMKEFIVKRLNEYEQHPSGEPLIVEAKKYTGVVQAYAGECLCAQLIASPTPPFDWQRFTDGKFPQLCFACSCGTRWHNVAPEQHIWLPVTDELAWEMLMSHNGVAAQAIAVLEDKVYLLQTLRDMGFIPIG